MSESYAFAKVIAVLTRLASQAVQLLGSYAS